MQAGASVLVGTVVVVVDVGADDVVVDCNRDGRRLEPRTYPLALVSIETGGSPLSIVAKHLTF